MSFLKFTIWRPFSLPWLFFLVLAIFLTITLSLALKNKERNVKDIAMKLMCTFNLLLFILYRGVSSITKDIPGYVFRIENELPLHLCNLNIILMLFAIKINKKGLYSYIFVTASLGALMAYFFPFQGFNNKPFYKPVTFGFAWTHLNLIILSILFITLGYYKPRLKDTYKVLIVFMLVVPVIHLINLGFEKAGLETNYFYTMRPEGINILELFYSIIPMRFVYLVFALVIMAVFTLIFNLVFSLFEALTKTLNELREDEFFLIFNLSSRQKLFRKKFKNNFAAILVAK